MSKIPCDAKVIRVFNEQHVTVDNALSFAVKNEVESV